METIPDGGILSPGGFRAGAARCGVKSAEGEPDVALLVADGPASAAGVFTTNRFAAAPVLWNRQLLPSARMRAAVVNSGNANSCTGERGAADVRAEAETLAQLLGCAPEQVCVSSTGIIGHPLPMEKLLPGIRAAHGALSAQREAARAAARAIMTTDTRPKTAAVRSAIARVQFCVGGMAKGAGMIAPHMATMLAFVTTDAAVPPAVLQELLREAADLTFNRITVDGDSSTNDTILVLASGRSGARVTADGTGAPEFREALQAVLGDLALQVVRDGEGATKTIEVHVTGATTPADAEKVARAVAESQLVKCAICGGDPNWGRIVCAVGYSGAQVVPEHTAVQIGSVCVFDKGMPTGKDAAAEIQGDRVALRIELGLGAAEATIWTCDLTEEYVRINARYHT
jgi:glutamate N-acetyltransferase/amino-acid N-acetyltransferase